MNLLLGVEFGGVEKKAARRRGGALRPGVASAQNSFSQKKLIAAEAFGTRSSCGDTKLIRLKVG
jgi:hypothetical protein